MVYCIPALPDCFHSLGLIICPNNITYFISIIMFSWWGKQNVYFLPNPRDTSRCILLSVNLVAYWDNQRACIMVWHSGHIAKALHRWFGIAILTVLHQINFPAFWPDATQFSFHHSSHIPNFTRCWACRTFCILEKQKYQKDLIFYAKIHVTEEGLLISRLYRILHHELSAGCNYLHNSNVIKNAVVSNFPVQSGRMASRYA